MGTNYGLPIRTGCATNDMKSLNKSKECTPICFAIYYSLQHTWMDVYLMSLRKDDPELRILLLNIMKGANLYSQVQVTEPQCSKKGKVDCGRRIRSRAIRAFNSGLQRS